MTSSRPATDPGGAVPLALGSAVSNASALDEVEFDTNVDEPGAVEIAEQLLIEAEDRLSALEAAIMELEVAPQDTGKASALLGITQGFAKAATLAELRDMAEVASAMEQLVESVVLGVALFEATSAAGLLEALDSLRAGFGDLESGGVGRVNSRERVLARLAECRAAAEFAWAAAQFEVTVDEGAGTDRPTTPGWTRPPTTHPAESFEAARPLSRELERDGLRESTSAPEPR